MKRATTRSGWPDPAIYRGLKIWGYTVTGYIASGGISDVYFATHDSGYITALKVLQSCLQQDRLIQERFLSSAKIVIGLEKNKNIVDWKASGYVDRIDRYVFFMEYIDGRDLEDLIEDRKRFSLKETV